MPEPRPARRANALILPMPENRGLRTVLILLRRMVGSGIRDASATMLAIDTFGSAFQRPLLLTRGLVVELARTSRRTIKIAPCCAPGITRDEALILSMIKGEGIAAHAALTDDAEQGSAYAAALALGAALHDCCPT